MEIYSNIYWYDIKLAVLNEHDCEDVCEYRTPQSLGYDTVVSYDSKVCVVRRTGEVLQCHWSLPFLANYESVNRG